jgi:hypothetical protein
MTRFDTWKRMSLVDRDNYDWSVRRTKRVLLVCGILVAIMFVGVAVALSLHSKGIL